jgi:hypothetical protein
VVIVPVGLWLAFSAVAFALKGITPEMREALRFPIGAGGAVASLLFGGAGWLAAALALSLPGREAVVRGGLTIGAAGMLFVNLLGIGGLWLEPRSPGALDLPCVLQALALAFPPALAAAWFAGRAAPFRPLTIALAAAGATSALGAAVALVTCPIHNLGHLLWGHAIAPLLGILALTLPLLVMLRTSARRQLS